MDAKIGPQHLKRLAGVYVRQSSLHQVRDHRASAELQYDLVERAVALGWPREIVRIYDRDQRTTGSIPGRREDFHELVAEVGLGHIGIVLGFDVTRLARNNADWYRLLDLCGVCDTLIADLDGTYDPALYNDRLLLGMKGTMSEAEHHLINMRLQGGLRKRAQTGDLRKRLPVGLDYDDLGKMADRALAPPPAVDVRARVERVGEDPKFNAMPPTSTSAKPSAGPSATPTEDAR